MASYVFPLEEHSLKALGTRIALWSPEKGLISEMWTSEGDTIEYGAGILFKYDPQPDGYEVVHNPREDPRTEAYFYNESAAPVTHAKVTPLCLTCVHSTTCAVTAASRAISAGVELSACLRYKRTG